jgi:uncharacterized membrane protein YdbT with pleckstrin-like domain
VIVYTGAVKGGFGMKFLPKRDIWLSIVIWSCIILMYVTSLTPFFIEGTGTIGGTFIFVLCFSIASFIAVEWTKTYYVINENDLFIRGGPSKKSIPFETILTVKPIRSLLASAATSTS